MTKTSFGSLGTGTAELHARKLQLHLTLHALLHARTRRPHGLLLLLLLLLLLFLLLRCHKLPPDLHLHLRTHLSHGLEAAELVAAVEPRLQHGGERLLCLVLLLSTNTATVAIKHAVSERHRRCCSCLAAKGSCRRSAARRESAATPAAAWDVRRADG